MLGVWDTAGEGWLREWVWPGGVPGWVSPGAVGILEIEMKALDEVCLFYSFVFHPSLYSSSRPELLEMKEIVSMVDANDSWSSVWKSLLKGCYYEQHCATSKSVSANQVVQILASEWCLKMKMMKNKENKNGNTTTNNSNCKPHPHSCLLGTRKCL